MCSVRFVLSFMFFGAFSAYSSAYYVSDKLIFSSLPNGASTSENELCRLDSELYVEHLENMTLWAHQMWDATAKSSIGILQGNIYQMGDWDECMKVDGPFRTQFCLATITANIPTPKPPRDPFSLKYNPMENVLRRIYRSEDQSQMPRNTNHFGWCIPASCTPSDLESHLTDHLDQTDSPLKEQNVSYSVTVSPTLCQKENEAEEFTIEDVGFCLLVAILFVICVVATCCDFNKKQDPSFIPEKHKKKNKTKTLTHRLWMAFSLRKNFKGLLHADDSNPALTILYGLRTFSIFMIIMDHRFGTFITGPILNYDFIEGQYRSISTWFIFHGDLFVDTFFVLSGILVTYSLLSQFDKKFIHPGFIILLRYVRLTPLYAFVIFYYATLYVHIGAGPIWKMVIPPESEDCRNNWWTNLLYISNYVNTEHMCMVHSWYLPSDFHYFIIGIFVVLLIRKNKKLGLSLLTFLFVLSLIIPFVITVVYLRPALLYFYPKFLLAPKTHVDFGLTYIKSHTRAAPYFIGMYAGYFYYRVKDYDDFHLNRLRSHLLTFLSILLLFAGIASGAVFYNPYHEYNAIEAAVYAAFHRPAWALGTVGILLSASFGHASFLKKVLSWSPWIPLSKLVYGAYLIHMSFQIRYVGSSKSPRFFNYFDIICLAFGDIVLSFALALIMYLGIEAPFRKVFRELLNPQRSKSHEDVTDNGINNNVVINNGVNNNGNCISRL